MRNEGGERGTGANIPTKTRLGDAGKSKTVNSVYTLSNAAMCPAPHKLDCELFEGEENTLLSAICSLKRCLPIVFQLSLLF